MRVLSESKSSSKISSAPAGRSVCSGPIPKSLQPQRGGLFVEESIPTSLPPIGWRNICTRSENNAPPGLKRIGDGLFYKQAAPLGLKRFGDEPFYKQAAPLGLKRFGDESFYKQAAPLGLKRFGDGPFYKQAAPLGLKKF
jgi:hypothetical protein